MRFSVEVMILHIETSNVHVATRTVLVETRLLPVESDDPGRNAEFSRRKLKLSCSDAHYACRNPVASCME